MSLVPLTKSSHEEHDLWRYLSWSGVRVDLLCQANKDVSYSEFSQESNASWRFLVIFQSRCFIRRKKKRLICDQTSFGVLFCSPAFLPVFSLGISSGKPWVCVHIYVGLIYRWKFPFLFPPIYCPVEILLPFEADTQETKWFPASYFPDMFFWDLFHVLRWASFEFAAIVLVLDKSVCNMW